MAVATKEQYWTSRVNGEDPSNPSQAHHNEAWTLSGAGGPNGSVGGYWQVIGEGFASITPTTDEYTLLAGVYYHDSADIPTDATTLMRLRNATHSVEVQSNGTATGLKLVGATTVNITGLDLTMVEDDPFITILRLTLDADGNANLYTHEIIEDDLGNNAFYSVVGASDTTGREIKWGCVDGKTSWGSVYATHHGVFNPDELAHSGFYQSTLNTCGISFRDMLRNSERLHLKAIDNSKIMYGYDLSSAMIVRVAPPTIHIVLSGIESPNFTALSGTSVDSEYEIQVYITTKGTDYQNAFRFGLRIAGDVFDEAYTNTGLDATQDSLISYNATLDNRLDADEQVCVHRLIFRYMKREKMLRR